MMPPPERDETCQRCRALVCFPAAADGLFCEQTQCPYRRLGTEAKAAGDHAWKW